MDMAYNFIVLRDCFGEFGQQRSNITSPIRYDPDIDRSIRVSVRQSFNFSGYVSGGHTDQQIQGKRLPLKPFKNICKELDEENVYMQRRSQWF